MNLVVLAFLNGQREWADARQRRRKPFPLTITTFGSVCNHALALHTAGNMACKGMIADRPKGSYAQRGWLPPLLPSFCPVCPFKNASKIKFVALQLNVIEN